MNIIESLKYRYNNLPDKISISKLELTQHYFHLERLAANSKNPLTSRFRKYFSQNDEDQILMSILDRVELVEGNFIEFGSGNGLENNTLILIALGWSGTWIDSKNLEVVLPDNGLVKYLKMWIDLDSVESLLPTFKISKPSVISVDLDGNDIYIIEKILQNGILPSIFICEYNGSIPPNVEFSIIYNAKHIWDGSNYYGASLKSYTKLFDSYGYTLVACNLTGTNSFFIKNNHLHKFKDISRIREELYVYPVASAHSDQDMNKKKVIERILSNSNHKKHH